MKYLAIALVMLPTVAVAQQAPQQPQPQPPAEIVLKVTPAEIDIISEGLQEVALKKALPLINKLREQIIAQQPKAPEAPK